MAKFLSVFICVYLRPYSNLVNARLDMLTEQVIGAGIEVSNTLGVGFLEKVYERALLHELRLRGITVRSQVGLPVHYKGSLVGEYCPDILVDDVLLVELKCAERLGREHLGQCLNYLRASGLQLCLLLNFQRTRLEWKGVIRDPAADKRR